MPLPENLEILYSAGAIAHRVEELAQDIAREVGEDDLLIVAILKGSFVFTADLLRALCVAGVHPQIDFMTLSSYGTGTRSSGEVQVVRDITDPVEGRHVLVIDDILESGSTLAFARDLLLGRGAAKVDICVLLEKPGKRKAEIDADHIGFVIEDRFVIGYGLDHAHRYRELPFIGWIRQGEG